MKASPVMIVLPGGAAPRRQSPPWQEAPEFRALREVRRAFASAGLPKLDDRTNAAAARRAAFWVLYELGQVIDQLARSEQRGECLSCAVRFDHPGLDRVVIDIALTPPATLHLPHPSPAREPIPGGPS